MESRPNPGGNPTETRFHKKKVGLEYKLIHLILPAYTFCLYTFARKVSAGFALGFRQVSAKFPPGFRRISAMFPPGFRQVSAGFPPGSSQCLPGFWQASARLSLHCWENVFAIFCCQVLLKVLKIRHPSKVAGGGFGV